MSGADDKPSLDLAEEFFLTKALPRRVFDPEASARINAKNPRGGNRAIYRRVRHDEKDRGELYPLWTAGLDSFSHFGIGIGIYFMQLVLLTVVAFLCGCIMMTASHYYLHSDYGITGKDSDSVFLQLSAACPSYIMINTTIGCPHNEAECSIKLRENCDLPKPAVIADLVMSCIFAFIIFGSKVLEDTIVEELDEAIQTVQDYSVEVLDPGEDADDPDEWYDFFSRFGKVRYITVLRKNSPLIECVLRKHKYERKIFELNKHPERIKPRRFASIQRKLSQVTKELDEQCNKTFKVLRVFCTFEYEEHQRLCLQELEVPDVLAALDIADRFNRKKLFRNRDVLDVVEPAEPDSVLWENLEVKFPERMRRKLISSMGTIGVLVCSWYIIEVSSAISSTFLAFIIGFIDSLLPVIFEYLVSLTAPTNEGLQQNALQVRLFAARLMLSTVLPYVQTSWSKMLDADFIRQISIVQVAACFTAPIITCLDISGYVKQRIMAPMISETQVELNAKWSGSDWSVAEKYTNISKVLFVSLYYALLTPYSILLSCLAFFFMFLVDRFLLLRKWKEMCMLDSKTAIRLRQQAILAVAAHMYVTIRFIYSWPMDEAYWNGSTYEKVNKYPDAKIWVLHDDRDWQSKDQQDILYAYRACFYLIGLVTIIFWVALPSFKWLKRWFCYNLDLVGQSQGVPFSSLKHVPVYDPLIAAKDRTYICSYSKEMLDEHRPSLIELDPEDPNDISYHIPVQHQPHVLSVVKYYGDPVTELDDMVIEDDDDDVEVGIKMKANSVRAMTAASNKETLGAQDGDISSVYKRSFKYVTDEQKALHKVPRAVNVEVPQTLMDKIKPKVIDPTKKKTADLVVSGEPVLPATKKSMTVTANRDSKRAADISKRASSRSLYRIKYNVSSSESSGDEGKEREDRLQPPALDFDRLDDDFYNRTREEPVVKKPKVVQATTDDDDRVLAPIPKRAEIVKKDTTKAGNTNAAANSSGKQAEDRQSLPRQGATRTLPTPKRSDSPPQQNFRKKAQG